MYTPNHMLNACITVENEIDFLEVAFREFLDRAYNAIEVNGNKLTIPSEKQDELVRIYLAVQELDEMEDEYNELIEKLHRTNDSIRNLYNCLERLNEKHKNHPQWN